MIPKGAIRRMIADAANKKGVTQREFLSHVRARFNLVRVPLFVRDPRTGGRRRIGHNRPMQPGEVVSEWTTDTESLIEYIRQNIDKIDLKKV